MSPWKSIKTYRGKSSPGRNMVDLWMHIHASPMSMGWADSFRVVDCWKDPDGKWMHYYERKPTALRQDAITHWMKPPSVPRGA